MVQPRIELIWRLVHSLSHALTLSCDMVNSWEMLFECQVQIQIDCNAYIVIFIMKYLHSTLYIVGFVSSSQLSPTT